MIIERKSSELAHGGDYQILEVSFHGYSVELHLDDMGTVKAGKAKAWYIENALLFNDLPEDLFYKQVAEMNDGETRIVTIDKKVERQICDRLFESSLQGHIDRAKYTLESDMYDRVNNLLDKDEFTEWNRHRLRRCGLDLTAA